MAENKETVVEKDNEVTVFKSFESEEVYNKHEQSLKSKGKEELLKKAGVKNLEELNSKLEAYNKIQEDSKTDLEKLQGELTAQTELNQDLMGQLKDRDLKDNVSSLLKELGADTKHTDRVKKLIDMTDVYNEGNINTELLKERVSIEAQELNLISEEKLDIKVGNEKPEPKTADKTALTQYEELKKKGLIV